MEVEGCTGACCAVFYFPRSPQEIKQIIEDNGYYNGYDGMMIADMLIPLDEGEAKARIEKFGGDPALLTQAAEGRTYTCRHWDEDTMLCAVYDHRPGMCATYPYGNACTSCGVTGGCGYG